ncbi:MAG: HD domain-containing protein [Ktedonobacteraceae bacterium]|nr:HD domain-containing protein [Ktedonobacteraceae bacterium]
MERNPENLIEWALKEAEVLLSPLGSRWKHVQGVAQRAYSIGDMFTEEDRAYLIASAYLHDIGYATVLQKTGLHPIDGACYLKSHHQDRLASLVAYHSGAQFEARLRGLTKEIKQFPYEYSLISDALTFCDMTTNSIGNQVSFQERIGDIFSRYDETHVVFQAINQATPSLGIAVANIQQKLNELKEFHLS